MFSSFKSITGDIFEDLVAAIQAPNRLLVHLVSEGRIQNRLCKEYNIHFTSVNKSELVPSSLIGFDTARYVNIDFD